MKALIVVDIQNDFCAGGALEVPDADAVVAVANELMPKFSLVVATQDLHPKSHRSFAANHAGKNSYDVIDLEGLPQVLWPVHCVEGTAGAAFHPGLDTSRIAAVFPKGTDESIDSYSGFFDNGHRKATGLGEYLRSKNVDEIYVIGLATDYCVKFTALDAVALGLKTTVIEDGCRGVGLEPHHIDAAKAELRAAGVRFCQSDAIGGVSGRGSAEVAAPSLVSDASPNQLE